MGLASLAVAVFFAGLVTLVTQGLRLRSRGGRDRFTAWAIQLGSTCFAVLWTIICIRYFTDLRAVSSAFSAHTVPASLPSLGAYLTLLSSGVTMGSTLLGMKGNMA